MSCPPALNTTLLAGLLVLLPCAAAPAQSLSGHVLHRPGTTAATTYVPLSAVGSSDSFFDGTLEQELFFNAGLLHAPVQAAPAPMSLNTVRPVGGETIGHNEIDAALNRTRQGYSSTVLPSVTDTPARGGNYGEYERHRGLIGKYTGRYESSVRDSIARTGSPFDASFATDQAGQDDDGLSAWPKPTTPTAPAKPTAGSTPTPPTATARHLSGLPFPQPLPLRR